ncbi:MAG: HipA domain-containing protein [Muribaculaceae bacterium]|nr:HipA domain-containing protein [Muribaculaceae bacterium]
MIDLKNCPSSLQEGFDSYSPKALKWLFGGEKVNPILRFNIEEHRDRSELTEAMQRISVSGVQEKFPALISAGEIKIAGENERSTHIIKPYPWDISLVDRKLIPANEHITMQIASQVYGIETAANGLCFTPKGQPVYITRRFDILPDGSKLPMEDFASIIGKNEQTGGKHFKYTGAYEDIAEALRRNVAAWMVDMERFFELIIFNYIYGNGDAHLKNFALILHGTDYRLAPAYDLMNTALHINDNDFALDHGLSRELEKSDIWDQTGHPCREDFERFGVKIGLIKKRVGRILDKYSHFPEAASRLLNQSYLPAKAKRSYARIVNERLHRLNRSR